MAFAGGPASCQAFRISGPLPADADAALFDALRTRAFGAAPPLPDDTQTGWIGSRHIFETELDPAAIACGGYAHLGLRIDRLRPPANILRAYQRLEEEAALRSSGREYLSKTERRLAREQALRRVEAETRSGAFRRIGAYPVLIDLEHKRLLLGTPSPTVGDRLTQLFHDTFAADLEPVDVERLAGRLLEQAGQARALEGLTPAHFAAPPDGYAASPADFSRGDLKFLGREFLTWLWYQTDARESPLRLRTGDELTVMIDRTLRLKCDYGLTGTDTLSADGPASLPEARAALKIGKQPTKMGLIVGAPVGEFRFTLDGERLTVTSLLVPEIPDGLDAPAALERRFELIFDAVELVEILFELFLLQRVERDWDGLEEEMTAWAAGARRSGRRQARSA